MAGDGASRGWDWGWQQGLLHIRVVATRLDCMQHAHFGPSPGHQDSSSAQGTQHTFEGVWSVLSPATCSCAFGCGCTELHRSKGGHVPLQFSGHNVPQTAPFRLIPLPTGAPPPQLPRKVLRDFSPRLAGFQAQTPTFRGSFPCKSGSAWSFMRIPVVKPPCARPDWRSLASQARSPRPGR